MWRCIFGGKLEELDHCIHAYLHTRVSQLNNYSAFLELHSLAQCLLQKGHKVIVVTHSYSITPLSLATLTSTPNLSSGGSSATNIPAEASSTSTSSLLSISSSSSSSLLLQSSLTSLSGQSSSLQQPAPPLSPTAGGIHPNHPHHSASSVSNSHNNINGVENSGGAPTAMSHEIIHTDKGNNALSSALSQRFTTCCL